MWRGSQEYGVWGNWSGEYGGGGGGEFSRACGEVAKSMGCGETGQGSTGGGGVFRRGDCEQSAATALTERREPVTLLTDGGTAHVLS